MLRYIRWPVSKNGSSASAPEQSTLDSQIPPKASAATAEADSKPEKVVYVDEPNMWIINDGLLRDEGVLFGLSGVDVTDKVASINSYFEQLRAAHVILKQEAEEKAKESKEALLRLQVTFEEKEGQLQDLRKQPMELSSGKVIRYLLGAVLVGVATYGSFYLLHFYITPLYGLAATMGIYFFGQFAQMAPVSSWLQPTDSPAPSKTTAYKEYLLEIGPSVVATLLAGYLIYTQSGDAGLAFMIGLFLLFLFFFNGKLMLGLSQTLVQEIKTLQKTKRQRKEHRHSKTTLEQELQKLAETKGQLTTTMGESSKRATEAAIKLEELNEQRTNKIKLFLSEYRLANHFSTTLKPEDNE
jgi:hypothetical protein